mmetsp:Transcript_42032/g.51729  ORF Transcript_42032/g.51729 Transcript_42032/m.51729 type:complete len:327 (+) Transcript_42032:16-996(+)
MMSNINDFDSDIKIDNDMMITNNNNNNNKINHKSRKSMDMDGILIESFMNHKRKQSQMQQLEKQFGALYNEDEAKRKAVEVVQRIDSDPYNLFTKDENMSKVLTKLHNDDNERETHLETAWDNDDLNMDKTLGNAYLNHKRRQSQYESLFTDFKLLYPIDEAKKYASEVMDQMDRDPYSLFEDDNLMERVLTKKYLDEVVGNKAKIVADKKIINNQDPTKFDDTDVKTISRDVVNDVMNQINMSNAGTNIAENILNEEINILSKEKDALLFQINNVDDEIKSLKKQVNDICQSKCIMAKHLNNEIQKMRDILVKYTKNVVNIGNNT